MRSFLKVFALCISAVVGAGVAWHLAQPAAPQRPDPAAVVAQMREVARLETLDVVLYKKVSFAPDAAPAEGVWGKVWSWARHTLRSPAGKAIVFADAHLGLDLGQLDARRVLVRGDGIWVALPPIQSTIELRPGETEVIGSNLDTVETAQLFEAAREAFARDVAADQALQKRARAAAERALGALLVRLGFREIHFVDALPPAGHA
jgi:hypothetical protein